MKYRTRRQLERMHVWTHRRFHDATEPKCWRYWLDVRTKIQDLIVGLTEGGPDAIWKDNAD